MVTTYNYLGSLPSWSIAQASDIAETSGLELGDDHIAILEVARQFFDEYGFSPSMRPLCKTLSMKMGIDKGP